MPVVPPAGVLLPAGASMQHMLLARSEIKALLSVVEMPFAAEFTAVPRVAAEAMV